MATVMSETSAENTSEARTTCAGTCAGREVKDAAMRAEKTFRDAKATVSAQLDETRMQAERFGKRARYAVEDGISEAEYRIRRNPLNSVALAFATGAVVSFLAPHVMGKKGKVA